MLWVFCLDYTELWPGLRIKKVVFSLVPQNQMSVQAHGYGRLIFQKSSSTNTTYTHFQRHRFGMTYNSSNAIDYSCKISLFVLFA